MTEHNRRRRKLIDMIIYENPGHQFRSTGYDATYAADPRHFTHRSTFEALDTLFTEHLQIDRPLWCLDLGCGQGQVAAKVHDIIGERAPNMLQDSRIYGLDLSPVAIRQCDESYPDLLWINDTLQDFLKREDTRRDLFGRFDLVINKGGLLFVESESDYQALMEGVSALLGEGGRYLYIQNKKFYAHWSSRRCGGWQRDIFDIAGMQFGAPLVIDRVGYFIHLYTKQAVAARNDYQLAADEPLSVEFTLNSGKTETWFVGGNEAVAAAVRILTQDPHELVPLPFKVPPRGSPEVQARHRKLVAKTAEATARGGPTVVVPIHEVWQPNGKKASLTQHLYDTMHRKGLSPLHYPMNCLTTRKYCDAANQWIAARPDAILLGLGLEDYRRDAETGEPWIDLDEFAARIDWLVWRLHRDTEARIVWIWLSLDDDLATGNGKWVFRAKDARVYQAAAERILRSAGVEPREIPLQDLRSRWRPNRCPGAPLARVIARSLEAVGAGR